MHIREVWEAWLKLHSWLKASDRRRLELFQECHADGYTQGYRKAKREAEVDARDLAFEREIASDIE